MNSLVRDWTLITGGLVQNGGGSTIFVEWKKAGGEIILCEQKEEY